MGVPIGVSQVEDRLLLTVAALDLPGQGLELGQEGALGDEARALHAQEQHRVHAGRVDKRVAGPGLRCVQMEHRLGAVLGVNRRVGRHSRVLDAHEELLESSLGGERLSARLFGVIC